MKKVLRNRGYHYKPGDEVQVYAETNSAFKFGDGNWRWRWVAGNRKIVADGSESYRGKHNAIKAARRLNDGRSVHSQLKIVVLEP